MGVHSILPPSSAGIWGKPNGCTGWPMMSQLYPETEPSPEALEGEASHEVGEELIKAAAVGDTLNAEDYVGRFASNGVVIDEAMVEAAEIYAKDVIAVMRKHHIYGGPNLRIEERVEIPQVHEVNFGTPDMVIYAPKAKTVYIWDYKFGFLLVDAFENWQMMDYLAGLLDEYGIDGRLDQETTVKIRVIQPRGQHRDGIVREWSVRASDLRPYFNDLHANAAESLGPNAKFRTGPHCAHCPGRHACPAAIKAGTQLFEAATNSVPLELTPAQVGTQLTLIKRARKQLEYLESGFEAQVDGYVRAGKIVPGWEAAPKFGLEKWNCSDEEVIKLGEMLEKPLTKSKPVTPKQARKLGIDEAVIKAYSVTPRTGIKIVPDNGNKAKQVFNQ